MPWYPASTSKLMTVYVTLQAVKQQRITLDTLFTVSARAASQAPSKIGFRPGTQITVDNALKILMVKSANDIAVVLAEGVGGSVEKFSSEMNSTSQNLGMTQSNWVNPNGLPADEQITSARDLAILARALIHDFPEYDMYWHIPAIQLGKKYMRNFNTLIGRYEGADGMKTGFICASGFNVVASASRNGKRLIAVVLGAPSSPYRAAKAAGLLERGFHRGPLSWLSPSLGSVNSLQPINAAPPDLRDEMCGAHRKRPAAEDADDDNDTSSFLLSTLPPAPRVRPCSRSVPTPSRRSRSSSARQSTPPKPNSSTPATRSRSSPRARRPKTTQPRLRRRRPPTPGDRCGQAGHRCLRSSPLSAPPSGAFTPTSGQPERVVRELPAATEVSNPALSYAPRRQVQPRPADGDAGRQDCRQDRRQTRGQAFDEACGNGAASAPAAKPEAEGRTQKLPHKPQADRTPAKPKPG